MDSPKIYHIENWEVQSWYSTGGTRAKKYIQNPDNNKYYYFKRSQYKPPTGNKQGKDFRYEFWSEIIAYQVGQALGFDILRYDIAVDFDHNTNQYIAGCICESMVNADNEVLIEGIKYLQGFDVSFQPELTANRTSYTFQLIEKALDAYELSEFKEKLMEIIVFDSLIGNGDRHQENWAIISQTLLPRMFDEVEQNLKNISKLPKVIQWIAKPILDLKRKRIKPELIGAFLYIEDKKSKRFAPIYDSGSSLGRELTVERVQKLLDNDEELHKYIFKGFSEIHWEGTKLDHFSLLKNLINSPYRDHILGIINRVSERFSNEKLESIVNNIDNLIPDNVKQYKLPEERKKLIIKIVTLRSQILKGLINERV